MRDRRLLILCLLCACSSAPPHANRNREGASALRGQVELEVIAASAPTVGDERPRIRLGFRDESGTLRELDRAASAFVPRWRDGAALIDSTGRLYQVWPDGNRRLLAADVLALATDGDRLAFVVQRDLHMEVRLHDGQSWIVLSTGLVSAGVLRLEPERLLLVGAGPGGVAGVWEIPITPHEPATGLAYAGVEGALCLSNCSLRTGQPWNTRFVPPPTDPELLQVHSPVASEDR